MPCAALAAAGIVVIEADWVLVTRQPETLRRMILGVLAARDARAQARRLAGEQTLVPR